MQPLKPHLLDQNIYRHWPLPGRPSWKPKGDARIAFVIYLYFERFEAAPPQDAIFDQRYFQGMLKRPPYHRIHAAFEYGNRVGVFRILDLLDRHGLRVSVAANSSAVAAYRYLVEQFTRRNFEFLAHGEYASRMITTAMPESEQRRIVLQSLDAIEAATGTRPAGWLSQDYGQSVQLPRILAESGLRFICDYANDEEPYLTTTEPKLVSVPNQSEWNDIEMLVHRKLTSEDHSLTARNAFDYLYEDGKASTKVFSLHIHPWMMGQPARFDYLEEIIEHICWHKDVWNATAGEIAGSLSHA